MWNWNVITFVKGFIEIRVFSRTRMRNSEGSINLWSRLYSSLQIFPFSPPSPPRSPSRSSATMSLSSPFSPSPTNTQRTPAASPTFNPPPPPHPQPGHVQKNRGSERRIQRSDKPKLRIYSTMILNRARKRLRVHFDNDDGVGFFFFFSPFFSSALHNRSKFNLVRREKSFKTLFGWDWWKLGIKRGLWFKTNVKTSVLYLFVELSQEKRKPDLIPALCICRMYAMFIKRDVLRAHGQSHHVHQGWRKAALQTLLCSALLCSICFSASFRATISREVQRIVYMCTIWPNMTNLTQCQCADVLSTKLFGGLFKFQSTKAEHR